MTTGRDDSRIQPQIKTIRKLLTAGLTIPDYQRPYRWGVHNVQQLLDDVERFRSAGRYRMGTVIAHHHEVGGRTVLDVVDGQQRYVTSVLVAHHLLERLADLGKLTEREDIELRGRLDVLEISPHGIEISRAHIRENAASIGQTLARWDATRVCEFAEFFLDQCEVVLLPLATQDEAFQMFDSQNTRGRPLYPTALLKAFHIREMSSAGVPDEMRRQMVRLWESISAEHVDALFADYLFKIKSWANGRSVPRSGFAIEHIGMFKGIREGDPANAENRWSMPFLYAKNFTDDFGQENETLIRYGALDAVEYPFQIADPVVNGETFFLMVAHYYALAQELGVFAGEGTTSDHHRLFRRFNEDVGKRGSDQRLTFARNLFDCLVLFYVDRFGCQAPDEALALLAHHAFRPRFQQHTLTWRSLDNYARSAGPDGINLFAEIRQALRARDVLRARPIEPISIDDAPGQTNDQRFHGLRQAVEATLRKDDV